MPFFDSSEARLYYRSWTVDDDPIAGLVFLHGGGEHSGQFSRLAARLNGAGINVWAIDHRGHGISGGERGVIRSLDLLAQDAATLTAIVRDEHPGLPLFLGGHSLGGWTTAVVLSKGPAPYAGAVLTGASLRGRTALDAPGAGADFVFDTSVLAASPDYLEELEKDPLVQLVLPEPETSAAAIAAAERVIDPAFGSVTVPVLIINGTEDALAPVEDARYWRDTLPNARLVEIDGGLHNVLNDVDHVEAINAIRDFVLDVALADLAVAASA
jgi:alpha-beta hydrolase superfamily lysophospholipase